MPIWYVVGRVALFLRPKEHLDRRVFSNPTKGGRKLVNGAHTFRIQSLDLESEFVHSDNVCIIPDGYLSTDADKQGS